MHCTGQEGVSKQKITLINDIYCTRAWVISYASDIGTSANRAVSHRNGFRAEYSGRNLAEYSADTVSVKIMGFGDERNIR